MSSEPHPTAPAGDTAVATGSPSASGSHPGFAELEDACEAVEALLEQAPARLSEIPPATSLRLDEALRRWAGIVRRRALVLGNPAHDSGSASSPWSALEPGSPLHERSLTRAIERLRAPDGHAEGSPALCGQAVRELRHLLSLSVVVLQDP